MHHPFSIRAAVLAVLVSLVGVATPALAEENDTAAAEEAKLLANANNPLANIVAFNIQNYYYSSLYGTDDSANTAWLRYVRPFGRWLLRASLPVSTVPVANSPDPKSGLGDFNAFLAYLVSDPSSPAQFGVGPLIAMPTATDDALGSDTWQAGAAAVYFNAKSRRVQYGGLVTYQTSFAGDGTDVSQAAIQPFYMFQLGKGTYLRGAPVWVYDFENDSYSVPFGLGIGQVIKNDKTVYNIFIEPQWTILHDGVGQPEFTVFAGLNIQFLPK
jgi:hypothetical protein